MGRRKRSQQRLLRMHQSIPEPKPAKPARYICNEEKRLRGECVQQGFSVPWQFQDWSDYFNTRESFLTEFTRWLTMKKKLHGASVRIWDDIDRGLKADPLDEARGLSAKGKIPTLEERIAKYQADNNFARKPTTTSKHEPATNSWSEDEEYWGGYWGHSGGAYSYHGRKVEDILMIDAPSGKSEMVHKVF